MARILYLGSPWSVPRPDTLTLDQRLAATGNNTGNLLIGDAIRRHLKTPPVTAPLSSDPKALEGAFDQIVIGASNFMFSRFDFTEYAQFLERVNLPCTIVGLGAQAPRYGCKVELADGTRRMLEIIAERCTSLGVRGYFTASTLIDMGIKNVRVIGCPSMYWTCQPRLSVKRPPPGPTLAVALNGSANVVEHAANPTAARAAESRLAHLALQHGYPYILQNERALMRLADAREPEPPPNDLNALKRQYGLEHLPAAAFVDFVRRQTRAYFDVGTWFEAMKPLDFVLGSRFHGCLIALLAGVPCCVLVHDTRTREMCELLRIPHLPVTDVVELDPDKILGTLDLDAFETAYHYLYQNYIQFLDENNIDHVLPR